MTKIDYLLQINAQLTGQIVALAEERDRLAEQVKSLTSKSSYEAVAETNGLRVESA